MKNYTVIKHDHRGNKKVNYEAGYHVSVNQDCFRNLPIFSIEWTEQNIKAKDKTEAIKLAKIKRKKRN